MSRVVFSPSDACELSVDVNTVHRNLKLSDNNRTVGVVAKEQPYPDHPDRFDPWPQLLCREALSGRCYWEVEATARLYLSVAYRGIKRKGDGNDCVFGRNDQSWSLIYTDRDGFSAHHNKTAIRNTRFSALFTRLLANRVGVYVDCPAGTLSFYRVFSEEEMVHLFTFNTTFAEPLYPGFRFTLRDSSVSLCSL